MGCLKTVYIVVVVMFVSMVTDARKDGKKRRREPPKWKVNSMPNLQDRVVSVVEGEELMLDCSAHGRPRPKVKWFINGEKISSDVHTDIKLKRHVLTIEQMKPEDKGNFTCVIHNKQGKEVKELKWSFDVNVIRKIWPLEIEAPPNITATVGETVTFTCRVKNDRNATIRWLKRHESPTEETNSYEKTEFIDSGPNPEYLIISDISEKDNGEYRCLAGNKWGVTYKTGYLKVLPPPTTPEPTTTTTTPSPTTTPPPTTTTTTEAPIAQTFFPVRQRPTPVDEAVTFFPPHRKNGDKKKNKKNRKKNRKNKNRKNRTTEPPFIYQEHTTLYPMFTREWEGDYNVNPRRSTINYEKFQPVDAGPGSEAEYLPPNGIDNEQNESEHKIGEANLSDSISLWTIYTIVGSIAGVILLLGLVAITVALCCRKEGTGVYKSTPV